MRRVAQEESGITLLEVLVASVLMIAVMGTAFGALQQFQTTSGRNTHQNEAQDRVRNAVDQIVKRLRNDAAPTPGDPQGIERATAKDLIFQSVSSTPPQAGSANSHNLIRVRYCLDDSDPSNGRIWFQSQSWTSPTAPGVPSSIGCPDAGWGNNRILAEHVVNDYGGAARPVWSIDCPFGFSAAACAQGTDPSMLARVKRLSMEIFVDEDPGKSPAESRLATAIYFRNQNAKPTAALSTPVPQSPQRILVNASASSDPDADRLFYRWCYFGPGVTPSASWCANGTPIPQQTVNLDYTAPDPAGSNVTIGVRVEDPGGLVSYQYVGVKLI
jgi:type II secretory pathway pseudopilin PulG